MVVIGVKGGVMKISERGKKGGEGKKRKRGEKRLHLSGRREGVGKERGPPPPFLSLGVKTESETHPRKGGEGGGQGGTHWCPSSRGGEGGEKKKKENTETGEDWGKKVVPWKGGGRAKSPGSREASERKKERNSKFYLPLNPTKEVGGVKFGEEGRKKRDGGKS